jgi:hypothetical protein
MPAAAAIAFLICDSYGEVVEADSGALRGSLSALASEAQFSPRAQVLEATGVCKGLRGGVSLKGRTDGRLQAMSSSPGCPAARGRR